MTQEELANTGGVAVQTQRKYESDKRRPDADYLASVAPVVDILYIITGERSPIKQTKESIAAAAVADEAGNYLQANQPQPDIELLNYCLDILDDELKAAHCDMPAKSRVKFAAAAYEDASREFASPEDRLVLIRAGAKITAKLESERNNSK